MLSTSKLDYRHLHAYKYQVLNQDVLIYIDHNLPTIDTSWISIQPGLITIKKGYCWDGASSVAIDTKSFILPSLVHDAIYKLIRHKLIPVSHRLMADQILITLCKLHGMWKIRAAWCYWAVRTFGEKHLQIGVPEDILYTIEPKESN